mgnify:CR=1 FL=1
MVNPVQIPENPHVEAAMTINIEDIIVIIICMNQYIRQVSLYIYKRSVPCYSIGDKKHTYKIPVILGFFMNKYLGCLQCH